MSQWGSNSEYIIGQPVLNFDFSTLILLRCLPYKFATEFLKGEIYFGSVSNWIKEEQLGNKGVGDILEGTCFSTVGTDNSEFVKGLKRNSQLVHFNHEGYLYFRRKEIESMSCLCLYGVHDKEYNITTDELGSIHYTKEISKDYFSTFAKVKDRNEYDNMPTEERPTVIFIKEPHKFFSRIKKSLMELGCSDSEIIISPVEYINKRKTAITAVPFPKELLLKDSFFSVQSEVRIILNIQNENVLKYLKNHKNTISIGCIQDIAEIYPYYFSSMFLEKRDKELLFNLPEPVVTPFEEMSFESLFEELLRIINGNAIHDGQLLAKNKELQRYCQDEMIKVIERVHGVHVFVVSPKDIQIFKTANTSDSANEYFTKHVKENG